MATRDAVARFAAAAELQGVSVDAVSYPQGTRTAAAAAAAVGCDVSQIIKSLVVMNGTEPALVLTAGHHRIDFEKLAGILGAEVRMANADEVREYTGYAIGGTPPFGHPTPLLTLLDPALLEHDVIYGAAGTPDTCFPIAPDRLEAITEAKRIDFAEG